MSYNFFVILFCVRPHSKYSFRLLADDLGPGLLCHRDAHQSGREGKGATYILYIQTYIIYTVKPVCKDHARDSHLVTMALWAPGP